MATEFNWHIAQLQRTTVDGVVFSAHYTVNAKNEVYSAGAYGSVGLEQPDPETMIPFDSLSEEIVVEWVKEKLGGEEKVAEIEAALQSQLDEKQFPSQAAGLPWAS